MAIIRALAVLLERSGASCGKRDVWETSSNRAPRARRAVARNRPKAVVLGERRVPRQLQDAPRERPQDLSLDARVLLEHLAEVLGREHEEPQRRLGGDGGGT